MKYYQNKTTGEVIGIENMREVISHPTEQSIKTGRKDYSYHVVYDMICPNHILGNGITSFCVTHSFLTANYKRINKQKALSLFPKFRQYRHFDLMVESKTYNKPSLEILHNQSF